MNFSKRCAADSPPGWRAAEAQEGGVSALTIVDDTRTLPMEGFPGRARVLLSVGDGVRKTRRGRAPWTHSEEVDGPAGHGQVDDEGVELLAALEVAADAAQPQHLGAPRCGHVERLGRRKRLRRRRRRHRRRQEQREGHTAKGHRRAHRARLGVEVKSRGERGEIESRGTTQRPWSDEGLLRDG